MTEQREHVIDVGLTGGIASGKSTAAAELAALGATVIDADALARQVVAPGSEGLAEVVSAFGESVLTAAGEMDRAAVGQLVFGDADARERLNGIIHPRVRSEATRLRREAIAAADGGRAVVVQDIPLLVETGQAERFDVVIVVQAPIEERVRRMASDRGMTEADARARIDAQATDDERAAVADVVLRNDSTREDLIRAVRTVWRELTGDPA
ncbi:dephospho-CoA kinase [Zhihengliuella halotolerans]|uniref:Dephospho-CoA kinase n=1 Tax=Zhihengliuella halotolerans TaxID=370736 RepID=A0A4Q8ACJ7_9MICC|nr:dephospho-CoA kinase [Zhihengliuella halotolerans]RZU61219.1 dephospho-CoA kinase [Zhihengliuella halotolerans]